MNRVSSFNIARFVNALIYLLEVVYFYAFPM